MNYNKLSYLAIAALCLLLAACSSDDACQCVPDDAQSGAFSLQVTASGFQSDTGTRAGNNELVTTFTDGDALGLIITHPDGSIDHVHFQYNGSSWSTSDASFYDSQDTYAAYFPYQEALVGKSLDEVKAACKPLIDQSDYSGGYLPSDLLVCSSATFQTVDGKRVLPVSFTHAYALLRTPVDAPCKGSDGMSGDETTYSYDAPVSEPIFVIDGTPCRPWIDGDGYARLIVENKAGDCSISSHYTLRNQRLTSDVTITTPASGQCYTVKHPVFDIGVYGLDKAQVGDFYCRKSSGNGYLIPGNAVTLPVDANPVGIVYWVGDPTNTTDGDLLLGTEGHHPDCTHGLVVALHDAGGNSLWSSGYEDITSNWLSQQTGTPYGISSLKEENKMQGYANTKALKGYNTAKGDGSNLRVLPIDLIDTYAIAHPVPVNSSDWYCPSVMELKYMCWGQNNSSGVAGRNMLNTQLGKVGGSFLQWNGYYWSSTEYNDIKAWGVYFGHGYVDYDNSKNVYGYGVRAVLAF